MFLLLITELSRPILNSINEHNKSGMEVYVESKRPQTVAEAEYWMRQYEYKTVETTNSSSVTQTTPKFEFVKRVTVKIFAFLKESIESAKIAKHHMFETGIRGS